jgi:protein-S-isoprenylcysteine O-methyltransferase Ste14
MAEVQNDREEERAIIYFQVPMSIKLKSHLFVWIQFICGALIIFSGPIKFAGTVSMLCAVVGGLLFVWALIEIKPTRLKATPPPAENMTLVMTGPYRLIRHPMYTAALLLTLAFVISDFSWFRLIFFLILLVNLVLKLLFEEELLAEKFPEYKAYMLKTKRLIPFVF